MISIGFSPNPSSIWSNSTWFRFSPLLIIDFNFPWFSFLKLTISGQSLAVHQLQELLKTETVNLQFTDEAIREIASVAANVNSTVENIGARRLHTILERILEDISFKAPEKMGETVTITPEHIRANVGDMLAKTDLSKFIL